MFSINLIGQNLKNISELGIFKRLSFLMADGKHTNMGSRESDADAVSGQLMTVHPRGLSKAVSHRLFLVV